MSTPYAEICKQDGPVLLLAGPGTGKTYQLARRIKYLIHERDVEPKQITVITFTASAAANMRARISDPQTDLFLERDRQPETICTMHSLGHRIIRENARALELPQHVTVVDSDSTRRILIEDAAQLAGFTRGDAEGTLDCRQHGNCVPTSSPKCKICKQYRRILRACGSIDYDDQILLACEILRGTTGVAKDYRLRSLHLLVDEYQDINPGQFELIKILSEGQRTGLFVVGDDDQSIYMWRGGSPEFIRGFEGHFGKAARVATLSHSYRCHRRILEGAQAVVEKYDRGRRKKGRFSYKNPNGPEIVIHDVPSDKREAVIVRRIVQGALPSRDVLVLMPRRGYGRLIGHQLRRAGIQYVSADPTPGMGMPILERLAVWLRDQNDSLALRELLQAMINSSASGVPSPRVRKADKKNEREGALSHVSGVWKAVVQNKQSLWESLTSDRSRQPLLTFLHEQCAKLKEHDVKDVAGFLSQAATALEPWKTRDALMEEVEAWMAKLDTSSAFSSNVAVRVMTLQGAKGLEADTVCVVGLEQGTVPRDRAVGEELAEQSRLMYVSMTRAIRELHLFHARTRSGAVSFQSIHGSGASHTLTPSPFLSAIPTQFCKSEYHPPRP